MTRTDEELLQTDLSTTSLTTREWARLAVLAADQAGLSAEGQGEFRAWLDTCVSVLPDGLSDEEAIEEMVRTDYLEDTEAAEFHYSGLSGLIAVRKVLGEWCLNDCGAARLVKRLGLENAAWLYLDIWTKVHAEAIAVSKVDGETP